MRSSGMRTMATADKAAPAAVAVEQARLRANHE